eukprot:scaffold83721_cov35-Prasinocladus_malaysianus.AAC.2
MHGCCLASKPLSRHHKSKDEALAEIYACYSADVLVEMLKDSEHVVDAGRMPYYGIDERPRRTKSSTVLVQQRTGTSTSSATRTYVVGTTRTSKGTL